MSVGSLAWGLETGGVLGEEDRAALMEQLGRAAQRLVAPPALPGPHDFGLDDIKVPDSRFATDALTLCRDVSEEWLVGHGVRSYLFAAGLGVRSAIAFDSEILYAAAMLHDLGITERYEAPSSDDCFAITGARAALDFSLARTTEVSARAVAEAISRHLNVDVALDEGAEAHLLSAAVTVEVAGLGVEALPPRFTREVLSRTPRGATGPEVAEVIRRQARLHPATRSGFLNQIGLADRALENPLDLTPPGANDAQE